MCSFFARGESSESEAGEKYFLVQFNSCAEGKGCYHILAWRLMIGQELKDLIPPKAAVLNEELANEMKSKKQLENAAGHLYNKFLLRTLIQCIRQHFNISI